MYLLKTHAEYLFTCKSLLKTKLYLSYLKELPRSFCTSSSHEKRSPKCFGPPMRATQ